MLITQLEGRVSSEHWDTMKHRFNDAAQPLPPAILYSYLIQDQNDKEVWRVLSIWRSRQALQEYRASVDTPEGILMFRAAGTEPTLSISEVMVHARAD